MGQFIFQQRDGPVFTSKWCNMVTVGIYQIRNLKNGKIYIGSTVKNGFKLRWYDHRKTLRKNCHDNDRLQKSWNKHGEQNFIFEILEQIDYPRWYPEYRKSREILDIEQWYIDWLKPEHNICQIAGNIMGFKHSDQQKRLWSQQRKGKMRGKNHPMYGKKQKPESINRMRQSKLGLKPSKSTIEKRSKSHKLLYINGAIGNNTKLTKEQVKDIRFLILNGFKDIEIAPKYNVDRKTINNIRNNISWRYI